MTAENRIREKLTAQLAPVVLEVVNESHFHAGHAGSPGTGESHFRVTVVYAKFAGKSRVERHRLVNAAVADELSNGVHALAIKAHAPGEAIG